MADRTERIQVRLSPEMNQRLRAVADEMGIPHSTVGAFAISEFVVRKEREKDVNQAARDIFKEQVGTMFEDALGMLDSDEIVNAQVEKIANKIK